MWRMFGSGCSRFEFKSTTFGSFRLVPFTESGWMVQGHRSLEEFLEVEVL